MTGSKPGMSCTNPDSIFSKQSTRYWQAPTHTHQKRRCLSECTWYYSSSYSTICYGISFFKCAHYKVSPVNLQRHCDKRGAACGVPHTIRCSIGCLVIAHNKKIRDKLLHLSQRAFTSALVRAKPLIHQGHTRSKLEIRQGSDKNKDTRRGVMIQSSWDFQVDAIIDVELGDADADTYKYEPMASLMNRWVKIKKTSTISTVTTNRNIFLHLFFQWTEC